MTPEHYRQRRKRIGTQTYVAKLLGLHRITVTKREGGTLPISGEAILAIAALQPLAKYKRALK